MRTVDASHPDRWPLEVLAEVMEEDLLKDIRYRRGLAYDLSAFNQHFVDAGYFGLITQTETARRAEVQHTIEQYFDQVRRGAITAEQVAHAQAALKGRWALDHGRWSAPGRVVGAVGVRIERASRVRAPVSP